jgi:hypothetical protein
MYIYICIRINDQVLNVDISVPDRGIRSQVASSTRLSGFKSKVKICVAMYIILVLFVLFLLVMCIWGDLQVLEIWDSGSTFNSGHAKPSQAKPGQQRGKPTRAFLSNWLREDVASVYF